MASRGVTASRKGRELRGGVRVAALVLTCAALGQPAFATSPTAWQLLDDGEPTPGAWPMVYDAARGRAVMLTESGFYYGPALARPPITWELVGEDWVRRFLPEPTPWNSDGCMAYDTVRGVTVLFGGLANDETWEYDGTGWTTRELAVRPPARWRCSMVYDSTRSRMVLFGGEDENLVGFGDTWEYDGTQWVQRFPSSSPAARSEAGMAYDSDRDRTVLFGGRVPNGSMFPDTWEYDGTRWQIRTAQAPPTARAGVGMVYDPARERTVMFGGYTPVPVADTFEWNGTSWTRVVPAQSPDARRRMALAWDGQRGKVIGFGGEPDNEKRNDTWTYDGVTWTRIAVSGLPGVRSEHGLAYDPLEDALVMYGGRDHNQQPHYTDTWLYRDGQWSEDVAAGPTSSSYSTPLVHDASTGATTGFSGVSWQAAVPAQDIHRYEGSPPEWTSTKYCCPVPDGRESHPFAYAPGLGGLILHGGWACCYFGARYVAGDLWVFDGAGWTQLSASPSPPARWRHGMAYDSLRQILIVYGGHTSPNESVVVSDTWAYDGSNWQELFATSPPGPRRGLSLSYDAARDRVVLFGDGPPLEQVTWEFDGTSWVAMPTLFMPDETRCWTQLAYDSKREVVMLFGGQNCKGQGYFNDTWAYGPDPDGDGKVGGLDNCRTTANPDQANGDGDVAGDVCDCAPGDATAWLAPQVVKGLVLSGSETTTLTWDDQSGVVGPGVRYDVATGDLEALRSTGSFSGAACLEPQTALPNVSDGRPLAPGAGFWYLVRARNVCGIGMYGAAGLDAASPCH